MPKSAALPRLVLLATVLALFVLSGEAQQGPAQPPGQDAPTASEPASESTSTDADDPQPEDRPIFRSGINFIRVDASVIDDDGNHVSDLEASDFEVYEDGQLQEIETFELIEIGAVPAPGAEPARRVRTTNDVEREAARSDVRLIVIFFDDYNVRLENGQRASIQITEFLERYLLPTDLVAVMYPLTPVADLPFTRNHKMISEQVDNWVGRKYRYEPENQFESVYAHYPTEVVVRVRNQVSFSALHGLMIHLGGLRDSRKTVLLVSEGYSDYVPPQLRNFSSTQTDSPSRGNPLAGDSIFEQSTQVFEEAMIHSEMGRIISMANRFNTSIYPLDPRGLAIFEYDLSQPTIGRATNSRVLRSTQNTLRRLADATDGRAIVNQNDFVPGMTQMLRDASAYYLLGYDSSQAPRDGEFHEIDVRVRREGVNVRSRRGYWAVTERDVERALAGPANEPPKAIDSALSALAEPRRGYLVRTWFGTSRGDDGQTRVTFVWEPTRGQSRRAGDDPARVLLTAMGDAGGAAFRGRVPERDGAAGRGLAGGPVAADSQMSSATFEVDPGTLQLSLAVEGDGGDVLDRDRQELDVPDFTSPDLVLSTPAFIRARNHLHWTELVDDWEAVPTPSREFRRTERLLLRFDAYAPGTVVPDVSAYLLNRAGERMYPLSVQPSEDGHPTQVDIQPASLAPGDYVVELTVTTSGDELTRLVAFRLTS